MNTMTNTRERVSSMIDGELLDAQYEEIYALFKRDTAAAFEVQQAWDVYHYAGDVLRSEDLSSPLSAEFADKFSALLAQEPVLVAPKLPPESLKSAHGNMPEVIALGRASMARYMAMTSMAAAVIVAFVMTPQLMPLFNGSQDGASQMAGAEVDGGFVATGPKLAANPNHASPLNAKETEFAPKLENQVEMLRDPRLDSYLMAHQKASPSLDNGGRYIQRANVVSTNRAEK